MIEVTYKRQVGLRCAHSPRTHWAHFRPGEIRQSFGDDIEVEISYVALCEECMALPTEKIETHIVHNPTTVTPCAH